MGVIFMIFARKELEMWMLGVISVEKVFSVEMNVLVNARSA